MRYVIHDSEPIATGRTAVIEKLKARVERFDHRMESLTAVFNGELISNLRGTWDLEARERLDEWMAKHANELQ